MKNITVLAIAFVFWFVLTYWLSGVDLGRERAYLVISVLTISLICLSITTIYFVSRGKMFHKFGKAALNGGGE